MPTKPRQLPLDFTQPAERRAGEMLGEMDKNEGQLYRGNIMQPREDTPKLEDLGISKIQSHRWQLEAEIPEEKLPPAQDLKVLIRTEHRRAELERLRSGLDGCGCFECQGLYQTLDLSVYGSRVERYGDTVVIVAGTAGADLLDTSREGWDATGQIYFAGGLGWATGPDGKRFILGKEAEVVEALKTGNLPLDCAPLQVTEYRRIIELQRGEHGEHRTVETKLRAPGVKQRGHKRVRPLRVAGNIGKHFRPGKAAPRVTVHKHRPE